MAKKKWIAIGCVAAVSAMVFAAEKAGMKDSLPAAVQAAVKAIFPSATIEKSEMEKESVKVYEVKIKDSGKEASMNVAPDGTVASIETIESIDTLPAAVAQAIKAQDAKVTTVEKEVKQAEVKLVKLDTPVTTYEVKVSKDGKEMEIVIAADGKILKQEAVEKEEKGDKDKD